MHERTGSLPEHSQRTLRWLAAASIVAMLMWFWLTNHIDLCPVNDLSEPGDQLASTLSGFIPFGLAFLTVIFFPNLWLVLFWTGYAYVWLALQIRTWWVPYLFGESAEHWRDYENTLSILPTLDGRMGPDLQHLLLELLSLAMAVILTLLTVHLWRYRRSLRPSDEAAKPSKR